MCSVSRLNWNLEMLVCKERGNPEYLEKNLSGLILNRARANNKLNLWELEF